MKKPRRGLRAFTLVELIVAMTVGSIVLAGIAGLFIVVNRMNTPYQDLDRTYYSAQDLRLGLGNLIDSLPGNVYVRDAGGDHIRILSRPGSSGAYSFRGEVTAETAADGRSSLVLRDSAGGVVYETLSDMGITAAESDLSAAAAISIRYGPALASVLSFTVSEATFITAE